MVIWPNKADSLRSGDIALYGLCAAKLKTPSDRVRSGYGTHCINDLCSSGNTIAKSCSGGQSYEPHLKVKQSVQETEKQLTFSFQILSRLLGSRNPRKNAATVDGLVFPVSQSSNVTFCSP